MSARIEGPAASSLAVRTGSAHPTRGRRRCLRSVNESQNDFCGDDASSVGRSECDGVASAFLPVLNLCSLQQRQDVETRCPIFAQAGTATRTGVETTLAPS